MLRTTDLQLIYNILDDYHNMGQTFFHWRKHYYGLLIHILTRNIGSKLNCLINFFVFYKHAAFRFTIN